MGAIHHLFIDDNELDEDVYKNELSSFFILPIQRIPRYILLLQDLIKNTQEEEIKNNIKYVLEMMKDIACTINYNLEKINVNNKKVKKDTKQTPKQIKLISKNRKTITQIENDRKRITRQQFILHVTLFVLTFILLFYLLCSFLFFFKYLSSFMIW